jgi:PIN domain nuclease of toxin-antitoxin system
VKILLDTCSFLWLVTDSPQLTAVAREIFKNVDNAVYLSVIVARKQEFILKTESLYLTNREINHDYLIQ